jgi:hypothetical protein
MNEEDTVVEAEADAPGGDAPETATDTKDIIVPKRQGKRRLVVFAVIGVVLVGGIIGGLIWHEQPGFCSALCHTPMITYYDTYVAEPGQPSLDKWGNEVDDAASMLAATHREADVSCLGCHEPTIGEQVNEGLAWVGGKYQYPLAERSLKGLVQAHDGRVADDFCLNDGCHHVASEDGSPLDSRLTLEAATEQLGRNPHEPYHGAVGCGDCHKAHRASVNFCSQCHSDSPLPDGWLSYAESNQIKKY